GYGKDVSTTFDDQGIPKYLMGTLSDRLNEDDPVAEAKIALELHGAAFRRSRDDGFSYRTHEKDNLGMTHVRMTQTYKGIPVVGGKLIVHLTRHKVAGINGRFVADLDLSTEPTITLEQAADSALYFVNKDGASNASVVETRSPVVFADEEKAEGLAIPVQ